MTMCVKHMQETEARQIDMYTKLKCLKLALLLEEDGDSNLAAPLRRDYAHLDQVRPKKKSCTLIYTNSVRDPISLCARRRGPLASRPAASDTVT